MLTLWHIRSYEKSATCLKWSKLANGKNRNKSDEKNTITVAFDSEQIFSCLGCHVNATC